jgi:hypothetical protein
LAPVSPGAGGFGSGDLNQGSKGKCIGSDGDPRVEFPLLRGKESEGEQLRLGDPPVTQVFVGNKVAVGSLAWTLQECGQGQALNYVI